jgi:hypothetical protein
MAAPVRASPPLLLTAIVLVTLLLAAAPFPSALAADDDVPQGNTRPYSYQLSAVEVALL